MWSSAFDDAIVWNAFSEALLIARWAPLQSLFGCFHEPFRNIFMIDVGLIGFGLAGRSFHAPVIRAVAGLRLAAILQRSGNEATEKYPDVRVVRSLDELLAISEIRLMVIATPNDSHFPLAQQCLASGRDVLVDKPFTTTLD
jgi:predicted dehydrogenase